VTYDEAAIEWKKATLWRNERAGSGNRLSLFGAAADDRISPIALAFLLTALLFPPTLGQQAPGIGAAAAYAGFAFMACSLWTMRARLTLPPPGRRREYACLAAGGLAYPASIADLLLPDRLESLMAEAIGHSFSYLDGFYGGLQFVGVAFVSVVAAAAIRSRFRRIRREAERNAEELRVKRTELERLERNVERLVEMRTAELEKAHRSLVFSLREKAETLAEMSVLEERSRIAYEIHDVVGHTLTAAIVQLEATKTLAEQQNRVPRERLELLSGLVRKGLNDIRKAVKLLKSDETESRTLEESLRELIQYTEDTMEIEIDADISLDSIPELGRLTEHALYHALQEGLTNGIRHGRCARARFTLRPCGKTLRFRLVCDGKPFGSAVPGFGLSSMIERVKLLGGSVDVRSSADADGSPAGCELTIELPLDI